MNRLLLRLLSSSRFFYTFLGIFCLSSLWIAATSLYPMAFDEEFHLGLIQLYATGLTPFGIERTGDMARFGAASADPSYLMHYILSFPYRVMEWSGLSENTIIVALRAFNVAFCSIALVLFWRGLQIFGASRTVSNIVMVFFSLVPILPLMAGQINYDNLLMLIVAACFLLTALISRSIRATNILPAYPSFLLIGLIIIGVCVKYAFIPVAVSFLAYIVWAVWASRHNVTAIQFWRGVKLQLSAMSGSRRSVLIGLIVVGMFFSGKFVVNTLEFGTPIPTCDKVFSEQECTAYGPWNRNFLLRQEKPVDFVPDSFATYLVQTWLPDMRERLTFTVAGPTNDYQTKEPLPLMEPLFAALATIGLLCLLVTMRYMYRQPLFWISLLCTALYAAPLAVRLYGSYVTYAEPVAINGRYLLPILPLVIAALVMAIARVLDITKIRWAAPALATSVLIFFMFSGGGAITYITQAESYWFWQGFGQESHAFLQSLLRPVVVD